MLRSMTLAAIVFAFSSTAFAVDFDPAQHGLVNPDGNRFYPDPGMTCTFLRNAVQGPKKVWSCDDGSLRYGDEDVWSRPASPVDEDFDPSIAVPGHSLLTVTTWINNKRCFGAGARRGCNGRVVQSISHMLVPMEHDECMRLAEKIAYRDYIAAMTVDERIRISYDCE